MVGTVLIGAVLAPGAAFSFEGRLSGTLWPIPATQVAHYAAVLLGCTVVLWFGGLVRGRTALFTLVAAGAALVGTHTRTALIAMAAGLVVAGASMFLGHARVRRTSAALVVAGVIVATFFAPFVLTWLSRGQSYEEASQLTGRTKVWTEIARLQRPWLEAVFGSGLSNKSFNGLAIDSNWLSVYLDQGWVGLFIDAMLLLVLLVVAVTSARGVRRAIALCSSSIACWPQSVDRARGCLALSPRACRRGVAVSRSQSNCSSDEAACATHRTRSSVKSSRPSSASR